MKIAVFGYEFPHYKTQQGIINLTINGYRPMVAFLQPFMQLDIPASTMRTIIVHQHCYTTEELCKEWNITHMVAMHHSQEVLQFLHAMKFDLGIVLGARILSKSVIDAFKIGILNIHPGLIPENRGLDNVKWAIHDNLKQAVTVHLIDERVDMGRVVMIENLNVYNNDTLMDIEFKLFGTGQRVMLSAIQYIKEIGTHSLMKQILKGKYNRVMTKAEEKKVLKQFERYKRGYNKL